MLHVARGWVHFTDASEAKTIAEPEYIADDIPNPHKGDDGIAPSSVGTKNASLYYMGIMGTTMLGGYAAMKGFILNDPTFFAGLVGKIASKFSNSQILTTVYGAFPRFRYTHAIKYSPLSFNDILQNKPIKKQQYIKRSLHKAIKENQLGIVKTLINYSAETNNNTNYIVNGSIYFRNKAHYNQLRSFLRTAEKKGLNEIRDYLIYRHISYALKIKNFNVATFYFERYNDIINYDDGLLSQEVITMIDNAVEKNDDADLKSALDRLHFLIKKEHNLNIHARNNITIHISIKHAYNKSCRNHLANIIHEMLQYAIIVQHMDHLKDIFYHISFMTLNTYIYIINNITSKLKNTLETAKKVTKEHKYFVNYLQIEKYIYYALISVHISHRNQEQIKLLLNDDVIDINYDNGAILKRLIPNNSENKLNYSDCDLLIWLVKKCDLDIHADNNLLFNHAAKK